MSDPEVSLQAVTRDNLSAVLALRVRPEQERFVASNAVSIAQAHFYPEVAWFRAVYRGDVPVGFVMLEDEPAAPLYCLWRFMIDAQYQGAGLGRRAMDLLLDHVRTRPGATALLTSVVPEGAGQPGPFYEKLGFVYTGEVEDGELMMRRPV